MSRFWFLGSTPHVTATVTDANGVLITPTSLGFVVTDPTGATVPLNAPTTSTVGKYDARVTSAITTAGVYQVYVTATVSTDVQTWDYSFTVLGTVPVVSVADLQSYLGVSSLDSDRATLVLSSAQSLCEAIVSPLPNGAAAVVLDVAARALTNPVNAQQQTDGPFSVSYGAVSGGLWLTNNNKATLRNLAGQVGAFTIDTMPATAGQGLSWWDYGNTGAYGDWDTIPS